MPEKRFERNDFRQSRHIQFTQQSKKLDLSAQVEADLIFDEQKQLRNVRARFDLNKENLQLKSVEVQLRQTGKLIASGAYQALFNPEKLLGANEISPLLKIFFADRFA